MIITIKYRTFIRKQGRVGCLQQRHESKTKILSLYCRVELKLYTLQWIIRF